MKAKKLFFALMILIPAIGLAFKSCATGSDPTTGGSNQRDTDGNLTGGILTVTDIPSEYNGRYALFEANSGNVTYIRGYQGVDESAQTTTLPQISNGKVNIPLWLWINDEAANSFYFKSRYAGNDTVSQDTWYINFAILGGGILSPLSLPRLLARIEFTSVTFSNGSAVISANTGTLEIRESGVGPDSVVNDPVPTHKYGCAFSESANTRPRNGAHFKLSISYADALEKMIQVLGTNDGTAVEPDLTSSLILNKTNWVIIEEEVINARLFHVMLIQDVNGKRSGVYWNYNPSALLF